jgi:hypothetical protein
MQLVWVCAGIPVKQRRVTLEYSLGHVLVSLRCSHVLCCWKSLHRANVSVGMYNNGMSIAALLALMKQGCTVASQLKSTVSGAYPLMGNGYCLAHMGMVAGNGGALLT